MTIDREDGEQTGAEVKLSERLEAARSCQGEISYDAMDSILRESAELARSMEDAPCVRVEGMPGTANGFGLMVTSAALVGQRVRLVPEAGQGGG